MPRLSCLTQAMVLAVGVARAVENGLARTPQMGWNNWNTFACDVNEDLLLSTASVLLSTGLRNLGYDYVVLDDCWSEKRGEDGFLVPDAHKFPNGMKSVADHLHSIDLLFGIYSSAGVYTCARYPGSLDYEQQDAKSFASWGVDLLKYDNCYHAGRFGTPLISFERYKVMADALADTGRSILYSLCNWGEDYVHTWGGVIANSWRMSGDIYDSFARPDDLCACDNAADPLCVAPGTHCSVLAIVNKVAPYTDRGLPGGWNDLDMLEVGLGGQTDEEYKAHISLWAALKSPLMLGNDIRSMSPLTLTIINNPAILAISQDPRSRPVIRVLRNTTVAKDHFGIGETHVWSQTLGNGDQVVLLVNFSPEDQVISSPLEEIFVMEGVGGTAPQLKHDWEIYDLWANRMRETDAKRILDSKTLEEKHEILQELDWYNVTVKSYADGLAEGDARLFGKKIGAVKAHGRIEYDVPGHSGKVLRLRSRSGGLGRKHSLKDEL